MEAMGLAPNEFEVDLGSLGPLRGRIEPSTIYEVEKRLGSFMHLAIQAANQALGFGAIVTFIEVTIQPVMGKGAPKRAEIEQAVLDVGMANVLSALHRPLVFVLNGPDPED